jgi:hypothetical protein
MRFWKKFVTFVAVIAALFIMQVYSPDTLNLEIGINGTHATVSVYCVAAALVALLFTKALIRAVIALVTIPFARLRARPYAKSVEHIVNLILSDDNEFPRLFAIADVERLFDPIKTAIALRRNFYTGQATEHIGIPRVDVFITKLRLRNLIIRGELVQAVAVANATLKKHPRFVSVIQEEILDIAKLARKSGVPFIFNPRKFRYGLSREFIASYTVTIGLLEAEVEQSVPRKIKIIEGILNAYPGDTNALIALIALLDLQCTTDQTIYSDKKLLQMIGRSAALNPSRRLAGYLLRFNRSDTFEMAQDFMQAVDNSNIEKLWFLLIIATNNGLTSKVRDLISKIIELDKSESIYKFYVNNIAVLSADQEIVRMLKENQ